MNSNLVRKLLLLTVMLTLAVPSFAGKRRSVTHPSAGPLFQATIQGTVLDAVTGLPVRSALVSFGNRTDTTTASGEFLINNASAFGDAAVTVSRTGYESSTQTVRAAGTHTLTFRLTSKPTVTVRKTDGTTMQIDADSVKLGYVITFSGYAASEEEEFCRADGTEIKVHVSQMKRIVGPATLVAQSACCSRNVQKIRLEQRNGQVGDVFFKDSCAGYTVDIIGREHVSGEVTFTRFSDIAEIVFP
jgi:hypothetical protein